MRFDLVTLFPEMFEAIRCGIPGRAIDKGIASINCWNPRDYTQDVHRTVDDRPYGGGPGMVMKVEPLRAAIEDARKAAPGSKVIYLSPQGRRFDQEAALQMSKREGVILLAGRYEGIDERLLELDVDEEWSIGDYVLSGGELPAMVMMDAIIRLLPDALGHAQSAQQDSHVGGLLDCPHFTRPEEIDGLAVPQVLLSGDHEKIRQWRLQQALGRTWLRRPDLLEGRSMSAEETNLLNQFIAAHEQQKCEEE
ncbi:tRNA (guanosine(37)-N1)-methyltransferase TrmD [Solemya velum gill symbiont]|uniref:tRNA (guanine-N(1)-)-methyltransferase n=1 Tax=Solemya velum gill symbiont TaxID=2340 RepID=A0A0B0HAR0_SOVGS|nr:tRNA (guanosine(37)-N1)-methyltransferase TrmD [Solemya velum gill symbiont]KHF24929.1 tRNA (Guanine37-N(1)-) methyltransferase [Solemya velum gill symbiont]OOY34593.1 tRNA (guanosine(37)-N1)-methyltransferase TrmD [Solemya velum gill symbiont]OOY37385.1 tRNA (guanosine(37)-N1)-methyltransferase TrmD [Solemya velum gill symbiont]OOY43940.1 tRNA (guanosine(37)-N1)-methyltransferase TrmD [Solemya velum gill symbiont]OOY50792.1 tRNA (guanosine(37)-N1)-methyltransferase TrmD [Solemya velum gill